MRGLGRHFNVFILISFFQLGVGCGVVPSNEPGSKVSFESDATTSSSNGAVSISDSDSENTDDNAEKKLDSDEDGLSDEDEALLGTDPDLKDTDGDTLLDGDEVHVHKTDPLKMDTDGDTATDYEELFVLPVLYPDLPIDPLDPDNDGDGFHPLENQEGWPVPADCNNLDPKTYPSAPDTFGDDIDTNCVPDIPYWKHTFHKGYTVKADIIVQEDKQTYGLKVYAFHDTYPADPDGECQVLPDQPDAELGCLKYCETDDYELQYADGVHLTGYLDDHACYSWKGSDPVGFEVERLSPKRFRITATGKENNYSEPFWGTVSYELGD